MADQTQGPGRSKLHAEFEALPLDEKLSTLFKMEMTTLSETFNYAMESPMKVVEKVGDMISDLGVKIETGAKKAQAKAEEKKKTASSKGAKGPAPKKAK